MINKSYATLLLARRNPADSRWKELPRFDPSIWNAADLTVTHQGLQELGCSRATTSPKQLNDRLGGRGQFISNIKTRKNLEHEVNHERPRL